MTATQILDIALPYTKEELTCSKFITDKKRKERQRFELLLLLQRWKHGEDVSFEGFELVIPERKFLSILKGNMWRRH